MLNEGKIENLVQREFDAVRNQLTKSISSIILKLESGNKYEIGQKEFDKIQMIMLDYIKEYLDDNFANYYSK